MISLLHPLVKPFVARGLRLAHVCFFNTYGMKEAFHEPTQAFKTGRVTGNRRDAPFNHRGARGILCPAAQADGTTDVRTNAAELAVAIDQSLSQIAASGVSLVGPTPQASVLPPSELATATPTPAAPTEPPEQRFSLCAAGSIQINSNVQKALTDDDTYRFDILFGDLAGDRRPT